MRLWTSQVLALPLVAPCLLASSVVLAACSGSSDDLPHPVPTATRSGVALHDAQEAVVTSIPPEQDGYFAYYCVSVNPDRLSGPASRDERLDSTRKRLDPGEAALLKLRARHLGFVPASECGTMGDDVMHLPSGSERALVVAVGSVELVSADRIFVTVFTTSGFLTETFTLFRVERKGGKWEVTSEDILLQA